MNKTHSVIARVSPDLKKRFVEKCIQERRMPSDKLRILIEDYVNPRIDYNFDQQLIEIINNRITHHTNLLSTFKDSFVNNQMPREQFLTQVDISKYALIELTEIGLRFSGIINGENHKSLQACEKCGMPSHPVFGARCHSDDCIGQQNNNS